MFFLCSLGWFEENRSEFYFWNVFRETFTIFMGSNSEGIIRFFEKTNGLSLITIIYINVKMFHVILFIFCFHEAYVISLMLYKKSFQVMAQMDEIFYFVKWYGSK